MSAASEELYVRLILETLDYATKDIESVNAKVQELRAALMQSEYTRAAEGFRAIGDSVERMTEPMAQATQKTLALSAALTALVSALGTKVYQSAVDYESALADLAKVSEGGRAEAEKFGESLNKLALKYAESGQKLLEAMTQFKQAGFESSDALRLVENSLLLMKAGEIEAGEAAQYLVSILKGYQAPASQAARAIDILNEVSNKYATNVQKLAEGMAAISPIAKQLGFSMEETAGLLTPIIEVFQSGSEAADALKTGLQRLMDDSKPVRDALSMLGVSQTDVNGQMRTGKEIFLDVARAFTQLDAASRQYFTAQLVGIDQAGRMATVFSNLASYLEVTETAYNSAGSAAKEVAARLATSESQAKRTEESFRQLSVALGKTVQPEITALITATGQLAESFRHSVEAGDLTPLLNALKPQVEAVTNLLTSISHNLETALQEVDWTPLVEGLRDVSSELGEAFAELFEGMDLTTTEGLREALQRLINIMGDLSHYVAGVIDGLGPLMDRLNEMFMRVSAGYPEIAKLIGQLQGLATTANELIPIYTGVASVIFGVIGNLVEFAAKVGAVILVLRTLQSLGLPVNSMLQSLGRLVASMLPDLAAAAARFTGLTAAIQGVVAAGTLLASYKIGESLREWALEAGYAAEEGTILRKVYDLLATDTDRLSQSIESNKAKIAAMLEEIRNRTGVAVYSMRDLNRAVEEGILVWDQATNRYEAAAQAQQRLVEATEKEAAKLDQTLALKQSLADMLAKLGVSYDITTGAMQKQQAATTALSESVEQLEEKYRAYIAAGDLQKAGETLLQIQKQRDETEKAATAYDQAAQKVAYWSNAVRQAQAEVDRLSAVLQENKRVAEELAEVQKRESEINKQLNNSRALSAEAVARLTAESAALAQRHAELEEKVKAGKQAEADLANARIALNKATHEHAEALKTLLDLKEKELSNAELASDNIKAETDLRKKHLEALAEEAKARGDEATAIKLSQQARAEEIKGLESYLAAKQREIAIQQQALDALKQQAAMDGTISAQEQAEIDRLELLIQKRRLEAESIAETIRLRQSEVTEIKNTVSALDDLSSATANASESGDKLAASSENVAEAIDNVRVVVHSTEDLMRIYGASALALGEYADVATEAFNNTVRALSGLTAEAYSMDSYIRLLNQIYEQAVENANAAAEYAKAVDDLNNALTELNDAYEDGEIDLATYIKRLEFLREEYRGLADEDLADLVDALEEAREEQERLVNDAISSLNDWKEKLMEIKGQELELIELEWQQTLAEAQAELAEARARKNAEEIAAIEEKIRLINEYYQIQLDKQAEAEAEKRISQRETAAEKSESESDYEKRIDELKEKLAEAIKAHDEAKQAAIEKEIEAEIKRHQTVMDNLETESKKKQEISATAAETISSTSTRTTDTTQPPTCAIASSGITTTKVVEITLKTPTCEGKVHVLEGEEDTLTRVLGTLTIGAAAV